MSQASGARLALFPGSFDPFTYGHLDIVERARRLFDGIEVLVAFNASRRSLLEPEERVRIIEEVVAPWDDVTVASFEGLLADYALSKGAVALVRGLRQVSDFDYEFRMAFANRRLAPSIETVFLPTNEAHALTSATIVRDIHRWGGDLSAFVPPAVQRALADVSPKQHV